MSSSKELYNILGVDSAASDAEIRSAYERLIVENPEGTPLHESIVRAYTILSDMDSRAAYDITGKVKNAPKRRRTTPGNGIDKAPNGAKSKLFNDLLEYYGDRTKAIKAKAKTYSKSFRDWFGDWTKIIDKKYRYEIYNTPENRYLSNEELEAVRNNFNSGKDIVVYAASNDIESLLKGIDFRKN